ncbi:MAG: cell division protein FtsA [Candidatus Babeliales bacterium]
MNIFNKNNTIHTSIDIGTTKIAVIVARTLPDHSLDIIGIGTAPSEGLEKGIVVNIEKATQSITHALKEAKLMANTPIDYVSIGVSGSHIETINSQGLVPLPKKYVTKEDIHKALYYAGQSIVVPEGKQILHALPHYFIIDGNDTVTQPLNMAGVRLEVHAHIILGAVNSVQNLVKCCETAGVRVKDIIVEQLASAEAVLTEDEKELGVAIIDIGGGTSDLAIYQRGSIRHTMVVPIGGNHFTRDIAICLHTSLGEAEKSKRALATHALNNKLLNSLTLHHLGSNAQQTIPTATVAAIIKARTDELLSLFHKEIYAHNLHTLMPAGIVLTGGGSLLQGLANRASSLFDMPVRIGIPSLTQFLPPSLQSPMYATGCGLILYSLRRQAMTTRAPLISSVVSAMKEWMSDFFKET